MNDVYNLLKSFFIFSLFLITTGCSKLDNTSNASNQIEPNLSDTGCAEEPNLTLDRNNVEEISLDSQTLNKSNQVSSNKSIGYTFQAEAGQKLSYQTDEDICIWVYAPNNELVNGTDLPETGTYTIQVSAPKGSKTFDLEMSLETLTSNATSAISTTSDSTSYNTPKQIDLTEQQALQIVSGWYRAKPDIFGYPFDESLVDRYTTGRMHYEKSEKDGGGSMGWLRRNGCYYTYDFSNIDKVWLFSTSGTRPLLKIQVSEKLQLHGPSSAGCGNRPQYYQKNVSYWFEKDNGTWKIYYYEIDS